MLHKMYFNVLINNYFNCNSATTGMWSDASLFCTTLCDNTLNVLLGFETIKSMAPVSPSSQKVDGQLLQVRVKFSSRILITSLPSFALKSPATINGREVSPAIRLISLICNFLLILLYASKCVQPKRIVFPRSVTVPVASIRCSPPLTESIGKRYPLVSDNGYLDNIRMPYSPPS